MRRVLFIFALLFLAVVALSLWQPHVMLPPAPTPTRTPLPEGFTLIPAFVPAFPCELQQANVYDEDICRSERVTESILAEGDDVLFIQHDYLIGQGCWGSISQDIHELRLCQRESGAVTTLTNELTSVLFLSPDGAWYAFGAMNRNPLGDDALNPRVYKIRSDGTDMQRLDSQAFPEFAIGAPINLRWIDDGWISLTLWDGTDGGYHPFRLKADGSGEYEPLPQAAATELP